MLQWNMGNTAARIQKTPTRTRAWHSRFEVELRVIRVWTLTSSQGLGDGKRRASLRTRRIWWSDKGQFSYVHGVGDGTGAGEIEIRVFTCLFEAYENKI